MFALVDCNNFYASCERVFNPALQNRPVAILSNNDGCVISMSDETKALNLPFGAPIFKWESYCKLHGVKVLSSNYPLYGDMSTRVMRILEQFTPNVEVYSIDEAFLEFKGLKEDNFNTYAKQIRYRILKWTGIPTCVGIAPTKALSKVANKIARKDIITTGGVCVIDSEEKRIKALKKTKIESIWGIGHNLEKCLLAIDCKTAYEFTQLDDNWVRKTFSIKEWKLKKELEGLSKLPLEIASSKRAIATTRSFDFTYDTIDYIKERIATFANSCAEKLREQKSSCRMIIVILRSNRYKKNTQLHRRNHIINLPYPTDSSIVISKLATKAVEHIFKKGVNYKKAGVIVTGLVPTENHQLDLFLNENPKHKPLMKAIDKLNKKYKADKIKLANQDLNRTWKMRQERLSPRYTTNINEIITVKC
jgi:DNA polymerase V